MTFQTSGVSSNECVRTTISVLRHAWSVMESVMESDGEPDGEPGGERDEGSDGEHDGERDEGSDGE